jgi:hypothetical protein
MLSFEVSSNKLVFISEFRSVHYLTTEALLLERGKTKGKLALRRTKEKRPPPPE